MGLRASRSSKLRGFLDGLDGLDAVDVVTGVVTDPAACADTINPMPRSDEQTFDPAERAREKQASRDADARALASGEKSALELERENEVFARLASRARIDLPAARSLG
jgi:hypothetical protein